MAATSVVCVWKQRGLLDHCDNLSNGLNIFVRPIFNALIVGCKINKIALLNKNM